MKNSFEVIKEWMNEFLPHSLMCDTIEDLNDIDVNIQQLIEYCIRKEIISIFLQDPTKADESIRHNLLVKAADYNNSLIESSDIKSSYNYGVVLMVVISKFEIKDIKVSL